MRCAPLNEETELQHNCHQQGAAGSALLEAALLTLCYMPRRATMQQLCVLLACGWTFVVSFGKKKISVCQVQVLRGLIFCQ
jgi:hypothetical protein